jgi:UDP-N-acetylglucosamine 2-epimerase (non-hydrolysing)
MKVCLAAGTRPEVIKLAPVYEALARTEGAQPVWVFSGQQDTLAQQAFDAFGLSPEISLPGPDGSASLAARLAHLTAAFDEAWASATPDLVIVQGDTSTTLAAALSAFARRIPVIHVEAGLRTFDLDAPFPEEAWRAMISQIAALHLAPTERAAQNLRRAGVDPERILVTGNTVVDALQRLAGTAPSPVTPTAGRRLVTVTLHRRENWEQGLDKLLGALLEIRDSAGDLEFAFVLHPNPVLRHAAEERLRNEERVTVLPPLAYPSFLALLRESALVLSDSGGVQEEAPCFGVPVLVLRDATERPEAVEAGVAKVIGVERRRVVMETLSLLRDAKAYAAMARTVSPFGDGRAADRVVRAAIELLDPSLAAAVRAV